MNSETKLLFIDPIIFPVIYTGFYEAFTPWFKEKRKLDKTGNGVYILRSFNPVPRCLKTDEKGILYIGKGKLLTNSSRLGKFINALNKTEAAHDGGIRFNQNKILEKFPLTTLTVEIILIESPRELEVELLKNYQSEYGELPPLNNQN